jgi:hypothetical protein
MMAWRQTAPSVAGFEAKENPIQVVRTTIKVNRALTKSLATLTHARRFRVATGVSMGAAAFTDGGFIERRALPEGTIPARVGFRQQNGADAPAQPNKTSNRQPGSTTPPQHGLWRCRQLDR